MSCKPRYFLKGLIVIAAWGASLPRSHAQDSTPLSFEVATIKQSDPGAGSLVSVHFRADRFEAKNLTLRELLTIAFDLNFDSEQQVVGGPSWIKTEHFDVIAKEDQTVSNRLRSLPPSEEGDANRQLIRALLTERFGLKVHHELRTLTTYTLETAKGGSKLSPGKLDSHLPSGIPQNRVNVLSAGSLAAHNTDMALFVKVLSSQPEIDGRTVVNGTGLKGSYDFALKWAPAATADIQSSEALPSLFSALQEQLGLKLSSRKRLVNVLLIDSVDKPSAN